MIVNVTIVVSVVSLHDKAIKPCVTVLSAFSSQALVFYAIYLKALMSCHSGMAYVVVHMFKTCFHLWVLGNVSIGLSSQPFICHKPLLKKIVSYMLKEAYQTTILYQLTSFELMLYYKLLICMVLTLINICLCIFRPWLRSWNHSWTQLRKPKKAMLPEWSY